MGVQMADAGIGVIRQKCQGQLHGSIGTKMRDVRGALIVNNSRLIELPLHSVETHRHASEINEPMKKKSSGQAAAAWRTRPQRSIDSPLLYRFLAD